VEDAHEEEFPPRLGKYWGEGSDKFEKFNQLESPLDGIGIPKTVICSRITDTSKS